MTEATKETTVQTLAEEAASYFEGGIRREENSDPIRKLKDDRPDWVYELAREAHGDFFPDDWRYNCIENALLFIAEGNDEPSDFADGEVDTYNAARVTWLGSSLYRGAYCDEAVQEFDGQGAAGIYERIGLGQYAEAEEVYGLVLGCLEQRLEEIEAEAL